MARVKSIFNIEGTLGELTFYKGKNNESLVRMKSSLSRERVLTDPAFVRTRENSNEFGSANKAGTQLRRGLALFLKNLRSPELAPRMLSVLCKVRNYDHESVRSERTVGKGLLHPLGRELLKGFDFNGKSPLGSVLGCTPTLEAGFVLRIPAFVPGKMVAFPHSANHVSFRSCVLLADFDTGTTIVQYSPAVQVPLSLQTTDLMLAPETVPAGKGILFWMLLVEFSQEINGVHYPLHDQSHTVLHVLDVVPSEVANTLPKPLVSAFTARSEMPLKTAMQPISVPEPLGCGRSQNASVDFVNRKFLPIIKKKNIMKHILHLKSSLQGATSYSIKLGIQL